MADRDKPAPDAETPETGAPMSALRRRTAKARAERAARLARNLRANIGRRKQQARDRSQEPDTVEPDEDSLP